MVTLPMTTRNLLKLECCLGCFFLRITNTKKPMYTRSIALNLLGEWKGNRRNPVVGLDAKEI